MENNNKKNIVIIILLSIIIALLIVGGLFLFNVITFKTNNDEQPKIEENNTETKYSVAEAQDIIDSFELEDLIVRAASSPSLEFGKNIFESEHNKSILVTLSMKNNWLGHTTGNCQGGPYTNYSTFANTYKLLFGKNFKYSDSESYFGEFIDNTECGKYKNCTSENIKDCYFTYNPVYMAYEGYNLIVQDTSNNKFTGKVYVSRNNEETLFGNFEFKYNIDNNNITIESLTINK